jgi:hypothetical protein
MMVTTPKTTSTTTSTTQAADLAERMREQLIASVQQGQKLTVDATTTWVKAVSVLPVPALPTVPGVASLPSVEASTKFTFDLASDLLATQRDFALQLANVLVPEKSA